MQLRVSAARRLLIERVHAIAVSLQMRESACAPPGCWLELSRALKKRQSFVVKASSF